MHHHNLFLTLVAASLVVAHPQRQHAKRAVSPDGTCGPANGYTCPSSLPCCSQWGWCGTSVDYCGAGCQAGFGTCNGGGNPPPPPPPGGSTRDVPRPKIGPVPYGRVLYNCVNNGDIAITFDDGPYIYTPYLLDVLARYNVKATFFIVGSNGNGDIDKVTQWSDIVRRTYNEGHQIASHTWSHPDLTTLSSQARRDQMYRTEEAIANIIGVFPTYMRPPYLAFDAASEADMADLGYHVVSTNLDTRDYANATPDLIINSQRTFDEYTAADPRSTSFIVLNHDIHRTTAYTLAEHEIQRLNSRGYRPVTVGQCLGDDPANWYRSVPRPAFNIVTTTPSDEVTSEELAEQDFPPPANTCTFVEDPNSIQRLMRLV